MNDTFDFSSKTENTKRKNIYTEKKRPTDMCWETGEYTPDCECEFCEHKYDCSGYENNDDDE